LPAADGERAEIVVTGLSDDAMPLVRYRLGDYVVKDKDERCACGTYFSTLRHIEGRESDALLGAGGEPVPSGEIVECLETDLGLRDFQLIQENATELLLRVQERPDGAVES